MKKEYSEENVKTKKPTTTLCWCPYCNCCHVCQNHSIRIRKTGKHRKLQVVRCLRQKEKFDKNNSLPCGYLTVYEDGYVEYSRDPIVDIPNGEVGRIYSKEDEELWEEVFHEKAAHWTGELSRKELRGFQKTRLISWKHTLFFPIISSFFGVQWQESADELELLKDDLLRAAEGPEKWAQTFSGIEWKIWTKKTQKSRILRLFEMMFSTHKKGNDILEVIPRSEISGNMTLSPTFIKNIIDTGRYGLTYRVRSILVTVVLKTWVPSCELWWNRGKLWRKTLSRFNNS